MADVDGAEGQVPLNDPQKLFLQRVLNEPLLSSARTKQLHSLCCRYFQREPNEEELMLTGFLQGVNQTLKKYGLHLKRTVGEREDGVCYILVAHSSAPTTNFLTNMFNKRELEFIYLICEAICASESGRISMAEVRELSGRMHARHLSDSEVEKLLERLVSSRWIDIEQDGNLGLSTRLVAELEEKLVMRFDAPTCNICSKVSLRGWRCQNCKVPLHLYCKKKRQQPICPNCKQSMDDGVANNSCK